MKKKYLFILCLSVVALSVIMTSGTVHAATCEGVETSIISCNDNESGIGHILGLVINIISIGVGILAVIGIIVAGIQYITAGGNEEQTRKSKRRIKELVIGLALFVVGYSLLSWLLPGGVMNPSDLPHYDTPGHDIPEPTPTPEPEPEKPGPTPEPEEPIDTEKCKASSGTIASEYAHIYSYNLNVPANVKSGMPLLLYLHGGGSTTDFGYFKLKNQTNFISIEPVSAHSSDWIGFSKFEGGKITDDGRIQDVKKLVDTVVSNCKINTNKIYIMGPSNGAAGVWYMIYNYPKFFAAAVPISGYEGSRNGSTHMPGFDYVNNGDLTKFASTKILGLVGGSGDYESSMCRFVSAINQHGGGHAKLLVMDGSNHDSIRGDIGNQSEALYNWLLKQKKGANLSGFGNDGECIQIDKSNLANTLNNLN